MLIWRFDSLCGGGVTVGVGVLEDERDGMVGRG
jgi:hypothetical protein